MREFLKPPRGRVRACRVTPLPLQLPRLSVRPPGWTPVTGWSANKPLYEWGAIVGLLLIQGGVEYRIGGMYLEYENLGDPEDVVVPPSFGRDAAEGVTYYNSLSCSETRDYLRVPLISGVLNTSDTTKFPKGNMPTFYAQTSGVTGVHGKPFSDSDNSKVFGGALVAFVNNDDATQDLVLSRFYFDDTAKQQIKLPINQIGLEWELTLK